MNSQLILSEAFGSKGGEGEGEGEGEGDSQLDYQRH